MSNMSSLEMITGMPQGKKVRRGRGKGPKTTLPAHAHFANAMAASKSGDHALAKRHAFDGIKASGLNATPSDDGNPSAASAPPAAIAAPAGPSGLAKLAGLLSKKPRV